MCTYHATSYTPCNHTVFALATFCSATRTELARINDPLQRRIHPLPFNPPECAPQTPGNGNGKGNVRVWEVRNEGCPFCL